MLYAVFSNLFFSLYNMFLNFKLCCWMLLECLGFHSCVRAHRLTTPHLLIPSPANG